MGVLNYCQECGMGGQATSYTNLLIARLSVRALHHSVRERELLYFCVTAIELKHRLKNQMQNQLNQL